MAQSPTKSNIWFKAAVVLVLPVVVISILGATVGAGDALEDFYIWILFALLGLMAICLLMGRVARTSDRQQSPPDENGVL